MQTYPVHNTRYLLYKNKNGHAKLPCRFVFVFVYLQSLILYFSIFLNFAYMLFCFFIIVNCHKQDVSRILQ